MLHTYVSTKDLINASHLLHVANCLRMHSSSCPHVFNMDELYTLAALNE